MARRGAGDNTMLLLGLGAGVLLLMSRGSAGAPIPIGDGRLLYPDGTIRNAAGQIVARTTPQTYQAAMTAQRTATQAARSAGVQEPSTLQQLQQYAAMAPALFGAATAIFKAIDEALPDFGDATAEAAPELTVSEPEFELPDNVTMAEWQQYQDPNWDPWGDLNFEPLDFYDEFVTYEPPVIDWTAPDLSPEYLAPIM